MIYAVPGASELGEVRDFLRGFVGRDPRMMMSQNLEVITQKGGYLAVKPKFIKGV